MNKKFNSASNENKKDQTAGNSVNATRSESADTEIQELLRKYLPEYADESDSTKAEPDIPTKTPKRQEKNNSRLLSLFRTAEEKTQSDSPAVPDLEIFNRLRANDENNSDTPDVSEISESPAVSENNESAAVFDDHAEEDKTASSMDDTDMNLMVAFGLEDQLDKQAGAGTAEKVAAQIDADVREREEAQRKAAAFEYTEREQTPKIAEAYKYAQRSLKIRMAIGAVLTVLQFFYENLSLFGIQFAGALDPALYPVVYIMMSLQIMLFVCAAAYEQIFTGFRNLITGRPTPESVASVLMVFAILYSAYSAITVQQSVEPVLYNFAVAFCAWMTIVFAYFNTKREIFSFNIVSSKKPKYYFHRIPATAASPESQAFHAVDEDSPDVLEIGRTEFVDGYFERSTAILHSTRVYVGAMLTVVIAASILLSVFAAIGGVSAHNAVTAAYISVLAAIPMSMLFTYSVPFYKANREAYENDSTIIGESSLDEYSGASIISFDDLNVFPSYGVKVQNIKIYNNNRIDRVLYYAASAYAAAGGPLADVFDIATIEMGHSDEAKVLRSGIGYMEAEVDGRKIMFGRSAVLRELGCELPDEIVDEDSYIEGDLSIMYMLRDGELIAKMYIKYVMDADFEFILRQFAHNGTCICVKTFDPNIDEQMIFSKVRGKQYPLKVIKNHGGETIEPHAEGGIVTRGTTKSLLQIVSFCDMVLNVKRTNQIISIVAALVSLAVLAIISFSGNIGRIGSWLIVVNQLFWMIPALLTTKLYIQ